MSNSQKTFSPNFFAENSVTIDQPISKVLEVLGDSTGFERVTRLSGLCTGFELLERDEVALSAPLSEVTLRFEAAHNLGDELQPGARLVPRQHFQLEETIPLAFGWFNSKVKLCGTFSWDPENRNVLYESTGGQGIRIWRFRTFEEVEEGKKVKVRERIEGVCPAWLKWIVQSTTTVKHKAHVDAYPKLF
ncbi:hypothetical protein BDQ17DRAFT_1388070 [Cyathus striatus]|nr:hypothetical protein BDQ17DRAFT_1388070 [Cyathus striatus]